MTTTEIVADTTGDHGAHPAADGTAVAREVTNYDGTFEEAMECGLIEVPPPVVWNMWQSYRKLTHSAPTKKADGVVLDNAKESTIYTRVMTKIYGPNFKAIARKYLTDYPKWLEDLELGTHPDSSTYPAASASAGGRGVGSVLEGLAAAPAGPTGTARVRARSAPGEPRAGPSLVHLPDKDGELVQGVETPAPGPRSEILVRGMPADGGVHGQTPDIRKD